VNAFVFHAVIKLMTKLLCVIHKVMSEDSIVVGCYDLLIGKHNAEGKSFFL
jgi:hypothetical protein